MIKAQIQLLVLAACMSGLQAAAQVPGIISHQGKLMVNGANFNGTAFFKFALVNAEGNTTWWSHDGSGINGGEPTGTPISLPVNQGVFSVNLGDTAMANMKTISPAVFMHESVWLRIWVDDGTNGTQRLAPDRRITSSGYALVAGNAVSPASTATNFSGFLSGDVTGTQTATVVNSLGGASSASVAAGATAANAATHLNVPGAIVRRDPTSGNIAAGTITGKFMGDGSGLTNLPITPGAFQLPSGIIVASPVESDPLFITNGFQIVMTVPAPGWINGNTGNAPSARTGHCSVWDGVEWLTWGGSASSGTYIDSGAIYRPTSDSWTAISSVGAPAPRIGHTAIWTGSEMIVWGGVGHAGNHNTGGRFSPATQTWTPMATINAPAERKGHLAVWTGKYMVVWGGLNNSGLLNSGGLYDPALDMWTPLTSLNPPAPRYGATGIWAGDRLLVWGGNGLTGELGSGSQLIFSGTSPTVWAPIATLNAPSARSSHSAVWNGTQMLIWGGKKENAVLGDGAAYFPFANYWISISSTNAASARANHAAVWTGMEMLITGGDDTSGELSTSAAYNPMTMQWRSLSNLGGPLPRTQATAVWTGFEVMVFGGLSNNQRTASLQRLVPLSNWYFYRKL